MDDCNDAFTPVVASATVAWRRSWAMNDSNRAAVTDSTRAASSSDATGTDGPPKAATSGSDTRPSRMLDRAVGVVDLEVEVESLFAEPEWGDGDRNTRTVASTDHVRVAVIALRSGASVGDDATDDTLVFQVLRGRVRIEGEIEPRDVTADELLTLDRPRQWRVSALEESVLLLTTALASRAGG